MAVSMRSSQDDALMRMAPLEPLDDRLDAGQHLQLLALQRLLSEDAGPVGGTLPRAIIKRSFDIAVSALLLFIALPVIALVMVAIKLDSPGPVFLAQRRVGEGGNEFSLRKLRTMTVDAEAGGARYTAAHDPRITRVGRFLRTIRLDEFPQLLNIVRGDMSFIGPRPERPEFETDLEARVPHFRSRLLVKPGVTGWAQIKGGYASTLPEITRKLEYDLYYIKNRSLRLDVQILFSTFGTVLSRKGR